MTDNTKDRFSFDDKLLWRPLFTFGNYIQPCPSPLDDDEVIETWRAVFRDNLDIPNDDFEEILDWQTRFDFSISDYLQRVYDGLRSGATIGVVLDKIQQENELDPIIQRLAMVGGYSISHVRQSLSYFVPTIK